MSSIALNTGLRALLSSQFVLETIGHNIANANTLGYSRQRVHLAASLPLQVRGLLVGNGVDASSVQRSVDQLLGRRILNQVGVEGGLVAQLGGLSELEALFAEPAENGLGGLLDGFFSSLSDLSSTPDDPILRTGAVQGALGLTTQFNLIASSLGNIQRDTGDEIGTHVDEVNVLAEQIAQLNVQIGETEATGVTANDLSDERDRALRRLADLVDIQAVEGNNGSVRVLVAGNTLVSGSRSNSMSVVRDNSNQLALQIEGSTGYLPLSGGTIGGLLTLAEAHVPAIHTELDRLARSLVLEINRVHSTGVPAKGPFTLLTGDSELEDIDGDGRVADELLSNAGLPFDVASGELSVNVTNLESGAVVKHTLSISQSHTTVQDFLADLNGIPGLSADLDSSGRVRIVASAGSGFDFSRRIDPDPDEAGTFGGGRASLGTSLEGPFVLSDGDTLDLTVDAGGTPVAISIPFATADFGEISEASAEEIAAVINADPQALANGILATAVEGRLFVQTVGEGATSGFTLDGGDVATALGWSGLVGSTISGQDNAVDVAISGAYSGSGNDVFTFIANQDGTIGTTDGLVVDVYDSAGALVASLDVGQGYQPGTELTVADGVSVSFGLGEVSASHNDFFAVALVEDSDTSDILVALGLNSLFTGSSASDISVRSDIELDPSLLASSQSGSPGDTALLLELQEVEGRDLTGLSNQSLGEFYGALIADLGFQVATTTSALESNDVLLGNLEQRRDQISGVNLDEELIDLTRYEQAFAGAAQYITVVNQLGDELLNLI